MGLYRGEVRLEKYNENWKKEYELEKNEIAILFGEVALEIEHIGSTSIEGLTAKPIIDIAVAVNQLCDFNKVRDNILKTGKYTLKEDEGADEILIRKEQENYVSAFIHVMEINSERYINTILFRDYLRKHNDEKSKYEELKKELALKYKDNRQEYTKNKAKFIAEIISKSQIGK